MKKETIKCSFCGRYLPTNKELKHFCYSKEFDPFEKSALGLNLPSNCLVVGYISKKFTEEDLLFAEDTMQITLPNDFCIDVSYFDYHKRFHVNVYQGDVCVDNLISGMYIDNDPELICQTIENYAQKYIEHYSKKEKLVKEVLQEWVNKQGHERCWYYPDIFHKICNILDVKATFEPNLPPKDEFEKGCQKYQDEEYKK